MLKPSTPPAHLPAGLPAQPFFALGPQRVRLARERYFDQGQRPTGLVPEPVIQSWARCLGARQQPHDAVTFDPVSRSRAQATLARSHHLLLAAADELQRLEATVGATGCRVLLTDTEGVVVHATPGPGGARELLPIVSRVGVNLAEAAVGTNAPAVVLKTGLACTVSGGEHFFDSVQRLHCAAAPIRNAAGAVAGVLDLTVEARPFGFDASALVAIVATAIENRLLQQGASGQLVLQFQVAHNLLGSPLEALVGVTGSGHLAWANSTAQQLLGLSLPGTEPHAAETLFGQRLNELLSLTRSDGAQACRLPNGLTVWMRAQGPDGSARPQALASQASRATRGLGSVDVGSGLGVDAGAGAGAARATSPGPVPASDPSAVFDQAQTAARSLSPRTGQATDAARVAAAPTAQGAAPATAAQSTLDPAADASAATKGLDRHSPAPEPEPVSVPTLVDHQRELIEKVLAECQGNISRAARRLGVSRGLLYRRRREAQAEAQAQPQAPTAAKDEH